jgi:predicted transcriptional regulator
MSPQEIKDNAFDLFLNHGFSKTKIAKIVGKSVQTISAWAEEDKWDETRERNQKIEKNMKARIYRLIDHSLQVFEQEIERQVEEGILKHLDKGHIDGLSKLLAGIKAKEISFGNAVKLLTDFIAYVNAQESHLAKTIIPFVDGFIGELRKAD